MCLLLPLPCPSLTIFRAETAIKSNPAHLIKTQRQQTAQLPQSSSSSCRAWERERGREKSSLCCLLCIWSSSIFIIAFLWLRRILCDFNCYYFARFNCHNKVKVKDSQRDPKERTQHTTHVFVYVACVAQMAEVVAPTPSPRHSCLIVWA